MYYVGLGVYHIGIGVASYRGWCGIVLGLVCIVLGWMASYRGGWRRIGVDGVVLGWVASYWGGWRRIGVGGVDIG